MIRRALYIGVTLVLMAIVLSGCKKAKIIPDDSLRTIFKEIYLSNSYLSNSNKYNHMERDSLDIYRPILAKHGYTLDDFTASMANFSRRKSIRVSDVLDDAIKEIAAEHDAYKYRAALRDSVDVRASRRFKKRVFEDSLIVIKRIADTSKLRMIVPVEFGVYEISYYYYMDSLDKNESRKNTFTIRNAQGKSITTHSNWLVMGSEQKQMVKIDVKEKTDSLALHMVFANYPAKKMKKPSMGLDSVFVEYYMPRQRALDSLDKMFFDYKLTIDGREYFGKPSTAREKDIGTRYIYAPRSPEGEGDID